MSYDIDRESRFERAEAALEEYFARVDSGDQISIDSWSAQHPDIADELRQLHSVCEPLRARAGTSGSLAAAAAAAGGPPVLDPLLRRSERFADYEIDPQPIAEGGMGTIFSVRDQAFGRELAMKVLRASSSLADSRRLARFLSEARVTSQLDHPGIVPVHEMGLDDSGRPYFTMKRVQGQTLERVLESVAAGDAQWPQARALDVLRRVCEAVAFAHKRGVIHRDLKPANVMVGDFGEVYVMDWGLARVLAREETIEEPQVDRTPPDATQRADDTPGLGTQDGDVLGTPAYMAPEQAAGRQNEVGRHSDVYSLGAMLYHLLAGRPPFSDAHGMPPPRIVLSRVLEGPPEPPRETARTAPAELIAICKRAMERDWHRRYPDVAVLSDDLSSFLEGRVVRAYESGTWAEARKWVGRNRPLSASVAVALLLLIVGIATTFTQYLRANSKAEDALRNLNEATLQQQRAHSNARIAQKQRDAAEAARALADERERQARERAEETRLVADFQSNLLDRISIAQFGHELVVHLRAEVQDGQRRQDCAPEELSELLDAFDRAVTPANTTNVARRVLGTTVFDTAIQTIEATYAEKPLIQAMLQTPLADTLRHLGLMEQGESVARAAAEARCKLLGPDHPDTLRSLHSLGTLLLAEGQLAEADPILCDTLLRRRTTLGDSHPDTLSSINCLGVLRFQQGRLPEAESLCREALAGRRASLGDDHPDTLGTKGNLAVWLQLQNRLREAEPLSREVLAGYRAALGDDHPDTVRTMHNHAALLVALGNLRSAEELYRVVLDRKRAMFGDTHPDTLRTINNLGDLRRSAGDVAGAAPLLREAFLGFRASLGAAHPDTLNAVSNWASLVAREGELGEAENLLREGLTGARATFGPEHPRTLTMLDSLAAVLEEQAKATEAEVAYREALAGRRERLGDDHPDTLASMHRLATLLTSQGNLIEAESLFRESLLERRLKLGNDHRDTLDTISNLAVCLADQGQFEEAESLFREVLAGRRARLGEDHPDTILSRSGLGRLLMVTGRLADAESMLLACVEACMRGGEAESAVLGFARSSLVGLYEAMERASPGQGYAAKADEYRGLLDEATKH